MMDSPFFRSHWNSSSRPRYSPSVRGIPVKRQTTSSPKVVSIPVHLVESDRTRSASALKIQKVFRGFLVRKSMKRILAIRSEVEEIERRMSREETVDLIRRDPKERLKVNETLMALLFKLDSVRGVDFGVRDCRKAVIRRAIALQETVDAIVAGAQTLCVVDGTDTKVQASDVDDRGDCTGSSDALDETVDQTLENKDSVECSVDCEDVVDQTLVSQGEPSDVKDSGSLLSDRDCFFHTFCEKLCERKCRNKSDRESVGVGCKYNHGDTLPHVVSECTAAQIKPRGSIGCGNVVKLFKTPVQSWGHFS